MSTLTLLFARTPALGVYLLFKHIADVGMARIPPVTLAVIISMVVLYLRLIPIPWSVFDVCLSASLLLSSWDLKRLIISTFEHADDMHLYYNMMSFLWKGIFLEQRFQSARFAVLLAFFVSMVNISYVLLAIVASILFDNHSYMDQCAIGFSGVIFALKVLTTHYSPHSVTTIAGFVIPISWTVWMELFFIQLIVPNVSLLGHLAGIIVGLLYIHGPWKFVNVHAPDHFP